MYFQNIDVNFGYNQRRLFETLDNPLDVFVHDFMYPNCVVVHIQIRGSVHIQIATTNVKLTLILKTHPPSLLTSVVAY